MSDVISLMFDGLGTLLDWYISIEIFRTYLLALVFALVISIAIKISKND